MQLGVARFGLVSHPTDDRWWLLAVNARTNLHKLYY